MSANKTREGPLHDERLGRILAVALDPRTDEGTRAAAVSRAIAHLQAIQATAQDLMVTYRNDNGRFGISNTLSRLMEREEASWNERNAALAEVRKYRERLAVLEAVLGRLKRILRKVEPTDKNDAYLRMEITQVKPDESID